MRSSATSNPCFLSRISRSWKSLAGSEGDGSLAWILGAAVVVVGVRIHHDRQIPEPLQVELTWLAATPMEGASPDSEPLEAAPEQALFTFDPNHLPLEQWQALGLSRRQAKSIHKFEAAGGCFRTPQDVARLYVVSDALFARWKPYLRFPKNQFEPPVVQNLDETTPYEDIASDVIRGEAHVSRIETVDLNTADTAALAALPDIGPHTARRLLWFRRDLGGFRDVHQINEVPGVYAQKICKRPCLICVWCRVYSPVI